MPNGYIHFEEDTWQQLREYTELCPVEVACMGYATIDEDTVKVNEVFLIPQVVSGTSVEFVDEGFPWAVQKAIKENRVEELRFCWHSHVNMTAHFSDTDKDMVSKVRDAGPIPWFASVVLNKKGDTHAQLDYFKTEGELNAFCQHVVLDMEVLVGDPEPEPTEQREEELAEFLTKKKYTTTPLKPHNSATSKGTSGITAQEWKLHNLAKKEKWDCYIDPEHYVHYWDEKDAVYQGKAKMPKKPDGTFLLKIEPTVVDARIVDELEAKENEVWEASFDSEEEKLLQEVMERGQG